MKKDSLIISTTIENGGIMTAHNIYSHTTPSRIQEWLHRHRRLIAIYTIGAIVILLQLRSIL